MSQQTVDLLNRWITETLRPVPEDQIPKEAARLVAEFSAYAEDAGVNLQSLEVDVGEDLLGYMTDALIAAAEAAGISDEA